MNTEERFELVRQVGEEIITEEELMSLLQEKQHPIAYDGFEPSGTDIHIAQGLMRAININKMTKAGCKFKMLVADWHAWANNKMGGDFERIQMVGEHLIEVWRVCGMDLDRVEFVWANDLIKEPDYWKKVMQIARNTTIKRIIRCGQIMGRKEDEVLQSSQILYPCMQCADIFQLKSDITQLGMDQRKVNVLGREIGPSLGFWKPVVVSHHMLMGLGKPVAAGDKEDRTIDLKMSKSKPDSAIFMTDTEKEISRKILKAYCPEKVVHENPILEYCRYVIFERFDSLEIERAEKNGGTIELHSYRELEELFAKGLLHPADLKPAVAHHLNRLVEPVREHFDKNEKARKRLETIRGFSVTR
jgi:tyrosyl-tRNA synthetase